MAKRCIKKWAVDVGDDAKFTWWHFGSKNPRLIRNAEAKCKTAITTIEKLIPQVKKNWHNNSSDAIRQRSALNGAFNREVEALAEYRYAFYDMFRGRRSKYFEVQPEKKNPTNLNSFWKFIC